MSQTGVQSCIETHFADGEEFEEALRLATENAESPFQHDFCNDWASKWQNYGLRAYMTKRQAATLRAMAELED